MKYCRAGVAISNSTLWHRSKEDHYEFESFSDTTFGVFATGIRPPTSLGPHFGTARREPCGLNRIIEQCLSTGLIRERDSDAGN